MGHGSPRVRDNATRQTAYTNAIQMDSEHINETTLRTPTCPTSGERFLVNKNDWQGESFNSKETANSLVLKSHLLWSKAKEPGPRKGTTMDVIRYALCWEVPISEVGLDTGKKDVKNTNDALMDDLADDILG